MDREDFLIKQIDEIREKAQQLQAQLDLKQNQLNELEGSTREKESKVRELEGVIRFKKDEADSVVKAAGKQLAEVSGRIENKLGELIADVEETIGKSGKISEEQVKEVSAKIDEVITALDKAKDELNEKVHSENVKCFRNVQSSLDDVKETLLAKEAVSKEQEARLRKPGVAGVWLGVINMILIIGLILFETGVIEQLLALL